MIVDVEPDLSSWENSSNLEMHGGRVRQQLSVQWVSQTDNESSRLRPLTIA